MTTTPRRMPTVLSRRAYLCPSPLRRQGPSDFRLPFASFATLGANKSLGSCVRRSDGGVEVEARRA